MPVGRNGDGSPDGPPGGHEGGAPPKLSFGQRILLILPRVRRGNGPAKQKEPISDWMRRSFLKPEDPVATPAEAPAKTQPVEELENLARSMDDKERGIGLLAAPLAAAIGFLVIHTLVANDPVQYEKNGSLNPHYVNTSTYDEVLVVLLVLSILMLTMALLRKRLYLGIATALYGLAIFNLHYWGFGIPFIMCAAWYLVRAFRLQRDLRVATGEPPTRFGSRSNGRGTSYAPPRPNKRYTPRSPSSSRPVRPKPENGKRAG